MNIIAMGNEIILSAPCLNAWFLELTHTVLPRDGIFVRRITNMAIEGIFWDLLFGRNHHSSKYVARVAVLLVIFYKVGLLSRRGLYSLKKSACMLLILWME